MEVKTVSDGDYKSKICNDVLRALPGWFGIEESIVSYINEVRALTFYCAFDLERPVGFAALTEHNPHTAEVHVMGVLPEYHRRGIGRTLIRHCETHCTKSNRQFLTVKTLADTDTDEGYAETRAFYMSCGFRPLEVFPLLWNEDNPCLLMAKTVVGNAVKETQKLIAHLHFCGNCADAIAFYEGAFGAKAEVILDGGKIVHASMNIFGQTVYLNDRFGNGALSRDCAVHILLYFPDTESLLACYEVMKEGGVLIDPLTELPYSRLAVQFIDRFGVQWGFLTASDA